MHWVHGFRIVRKDGRRVHAGVALRALGHWRSKTMATFSLSKTTMALELVRQSQAYWQNAAGHSRSNRCSFAIFRNLVAAIHCRASKYVLIGHVEDFIVDTEDWRLRYLVVDTRNWLPGKKVLIAPWCVQHIRVQDRQVQVDLPRERLKDSPEYDPKQPIQRSYEERLFAYYGWPKYWQ